MELIATNINELRHNCIDILYSTDSVDVLKRIKDFMLSFVSKKEVSETAAVSPKTQYVLDNICGKIDNEEFFDAVSDAHNHLFRTVNFD